MRGAHKHLSSDCMNDQIHEWKKATAFAIIINDGAN